MSLPDVPVRVWRHGKCEDPLVPVPGPSADHEDGTVAVPCRWTTSSGPRPAVRWVEELLEQATLAHDAFPCCGPA